MSPHTTGAWVFTRDTDRSGTEVMSVHTKEYPNPLLPGEVMPMAIAMVFRERDAPIITAAPRLLTSLKDFVDVIDARGWVSASFCEGCQQHAPAEMTPDGHGLAKLGKLVHVDSCPYDRARRLLAELRAPR